MICETVATNHETIMSRGGSRAAATSKMECFRLEAVNYYHKALHLGCCSSPRSASDEWVNNSRPQYSLTESDSVISESSIFSSQLSDWKNSISEFSVNNSPSRTHNEKEKNTSQRQSNKIKKCVKYPPTKNNMNLNVAEVKSNNDHPPP